MITTFGGPILRTIFRPIASSRLLWSIGKGYLTPGMAMICSCHVVSERRIQRAIDHGACSIADVAAVCGAGGTCHGCHDAIDELIETSADDRRGVPASIRVRVA